MRHYPGDFVLSDSFDIPLVRLCWESQLATARQLHQLLQLHIAACTKSKRAFANRLKRLKDKGYLRRDSIVAAGATTVYTVTQDGVASLLEHGQIATNCGGTANVLASAIQLLYLNDIRISFFDRYSCEEWVSQKAWQANACYRRSIAIGPDLDGRVTVRRNWGSVQIGIFYAVPLRPFLQYMLDEEWLIAQRVHWIVFLVASQNEADYVAKHLPLSQVIVCVVTWDDFRKNLLGATPFSPGSEQHLSLESLITRHLQPSFQF